MASMLLGSMGMGQPRFFAVALRTVFAMSLVGCTVDADDSRFVDDDDTRDGMTGKGDIIGQDDLIPVQEDGANIPSRYRHVLDAIGLIEFRVNGKRFHCTGTHIGDGVMLTAGHCFKEFGVSADTVLAQSLEKGSCIVHWGVRSIEGGYLESDCTVLLGAKFVVNGIDAAVVEVSPAPSARVELARTQVADGSRVTIFSHPRGRTLEWSQTCRLRYGELSSGFYHLCDTEPGSSGAAVLDYATLTIVGIHNAGLDTRNRATVMFNGFEF